MTILDLDQATHRDSLKVLLTLLVHEIAPRNCPPLHDSGQRNGAGRWEFEVVGRAHGKVGKELELADAVRSQLKVTNR